MAYNIGDVYGAMAYAETGSFEDPWIRTIAEGTGSSAYGPVGLTGGEKYGSMMWNVYHDPKLAKKVGITENERQYVSSFLEQADKFLDPVSDEEYSTYGYGGPGILRSDEDKVLYKSIAKKLFKYELEERAEGNIDLFLERMRGSTKHFRGGKDVSHTTKFKGELERLTKLRNNKNDKELLLPDEAIMDTILKGAR